MKKKNRCFVVILAVVLLAAGGCANGARKDGAGEQQEFHVYIAFGQSNMQGPGEIEEQDKGSAGGRFFVMNIIPGIYAGENREAFAWYPAEPPLIIPDRNLINYLGIPTGLSPADYFGRTLAAHTPERVKIGVIAAAAGDLALAAFDKTRASDYFDGIGTESGRPSATEKQGMDRYGKDIYGAIIQAAHTAQRDGAVIKGIIVHQGESGAGFAGIEWSELLKNIYDDMLRDLDIAPDSIPILLGQCWDGGLGKTGGALDSDNRIRQVIPNAWIISSAGCTGRTGKGQPDNTHFGAEGIRLLGTRYGEKMLELNYGAAEK